MEDLLLGPAAFTIEALFYVGEACSTPSVGGAWGAAVATGATLPWFEDAGALATVALADLHLRLRDSLLGLRRGFLRWLLVASVAWRRRIEARVLLGEWLLALVIRSVSLVLALVGDSLATPGHFLSLLFLAVWFTD